MENNVKLQDINILLDKAYYQIERSLNRDTFEKIEWGVAKGLDELIEAQKLLKELIDDKS